MQQLTGKEHKVLFLRVFRPISVQSILNRVVLLAFVWQLAALGQSNQRIPSPQSSMPDSGTTSRNAENLNSLSIPSGGLQPLPPVSGEIAARPEFTREMIQVQWRRGDPIELYVVRPLGVSKPKPIVYLYSYPSDTNRFQDDNYCSRVTAGGFAAIGFVSALTGQRYHDRPMKEWFVSELAESLTTSVHDVQMILNYLADRGDFNLDGVGMFGQGSGATIAILAATVDSRIRILDLLEPWGDWPDWLAGSTLVPDSERSGFLQPEFLVKVAPLDPVKWLFDLPAQAVRIQTVADNRITPTDARRHIVAAAPASSKVVMYSTTRELYTATADGKLFEWMKGQLNTPHKSPADAISVPELRKVDCHKRTSC